MCTAKRYKLSISSSASLLFLDERGHPEDGYSTDDGRAQLAQDATPGYAKLPEEPAADQTAKESQYKIHNESETTTFHQLTGTETCQTSNND